MIKKYEIINDGGKKRIKALRSFHVQGRYVNIGDVGGIVYDENTLSQEGNCWIFSGNLNYPSIRVSGDSIVDTNGYEANVTDPRPFVNVTGTSALIGAHDFVTGKASAAKVLAPSDMEVGIVAVAVGKTYEESKEANPTSLRVKATLYRGGTKTTVRITNPDYQIKVLRYDVNGLLFSASPNWVTGGPGTAVTTEDCYYYAVLVRKTVGDTITVADITTAAVTVSEPVTESEININDSRLEFQYTSAMTVATKVNIANTTLIDVNKSTIDTTIDTSNVAISKTGGGAFVANIFADVVKCNVEFRLVSNNSLLIGNFANIDRLINDGSYSFAVSKATRDKINAKDCYTFTQSEQIISTAVLGSVPNNTPFIFTRCNVEHGTFYHNPVNRNIYTDIDFEKALTDLSEPLANADLILVSGEREGMYRVASKSTRALGPLVEDIHSVKNLNLTAVGPNTQGVEIYGDAYLEGAFTLEGNQVYGGSFGHDRSDDIQAHMVAVRGAFNTQSVGQIITGLVDNANTMVIAQPVRVNGLHGLELDGLTGSGVTATLAFTDIRGKIAVVDAHSSDMPKLMEDDVKYHQAYITFSKVGGPVTEDDLKGIVIRTFNGCKVVNTGDAAISVKGSVRVEDNASVYNSAIGGSGYFGGNSVTENAEVNGSMFIKDNAVFAPVAEAGKDDAYIEMQDNAKFLATSRSGNSRIIMSGDSLFSGVLAFSTISLEMRDSAKIGGRLGGKGTLRMSDDADTSDKELTAWGLVRLVGPYKQTAARTFRGNRVISDELEPEYDNNVKTQYDF